MIQSKLGVLMVNLGTVDAPTPQAVKRYLAEFFSDRRVVDTSPWLWQRLLRSLILPICSPRVANLYSCSTSTTVWDAVARILKDYHRLRSVSFIRDYSEHPAYISALKQSVELAFAQHGQPDRLIMSFHGIPKRYAQLGDDYPIRCEDTYQALKAELSLPTERIMMTYQSRFGRERWLTPYTDETLKMSSFTRY